MMESTQEREAIGERTADALAHLRANGRRTSRFAPFGYRHGDDGELREVPHEQEAVRRIHNLKAEGLSLRKIGEALARAGYFGRGGKVMGPRLIRAVLNRPPLGHP